MPDITTTFTRVIDGDFHELEGSLDPSKMESFLLGITKPSPASIDDIDDDFGTEYRELEVEVIYSDDSYHIITLNYEDSPDPVWITNLARKESYNPTSETVKNYTFKELSEAIQYVLDTVKRLSG